MDTLQIILLTAAALALLTTLASLRTPRRTAEGDAKRNPLLTLLAALTLVAILAAIAYSLVSGYSINITRNP